MYITIDLSEAIFPLPDSNVIKESGEALVEQYPEVNQFPSTRDAIKEFEDAIHFMVQQIGAEYTKMYAEEEKQTGSTTSLNKQVTNLAVQAKQ